MSQEPYYTHPYRQLGLKSVINASGRVTVLGVSTISDRVADASRYAAQSFVVMKELLQVAGDELARFTGAQAAVPTCSASAAIALLVAGLIAKDNLPAIKALPQSDGLANEIILQKGHVINYGAPMTTMIRLGGGVPIEVGEATEVCPADIEGAITERTAALLYVQSHHCVHKGMQSIETMRDIAHRHNLPFIMDCAAEEDFQRYIALGADAVVYSGAKALEATTSGFVCGRKDLMSFVLANYDGIGRAMKVGKEQIVGLLEAVRQYETKDQHASACQTKARATELSDKISQALTSLGVADRLRCGLVTDQVRPDIVRSRLTVRASESYPSAAQLNTLLRNGDPVIWARTEFLAEGHIDFDPRPLDKGDVDLLVERLTQLVKEHYVS